MPLRTTASPTEGTRPGASNTITVAVHNPPTSGPFAANSNAVEVDVSQSQPTYFMKVLGWQAVPVSTAAVAVTLGSGSCLYSLDPVGVGSGDSRWYRERLFGVRPVRQFE